MSDDVVTKIGSKAAMLYREIGDVDQTVERMMEWLEAHPEDRDAVMRAVVLSTVVALAQVWKPVTFEHN
jgi:hypothetical protein